MIKQFKKEVCEKCPSFGKIKSFSGVKPFCAETSLDEAHCKIKWLLKKNRELEGILNLLNKAHRRKMK